eukprot:tig00001107_g7110.t1
MATVGGPQQGQGQTRLDRLCILLESGSTPEARRSAAEQIGELQKQRPDDLRGLLRRVEPFLFKKSWDARVAAGQAIEAIVRAAPPPPPPVKQEGSGRSEAGAAGDGVLRFAGFDLNHVFEHGQALLASGGQEYDEVGDVSEAGRRERAAALRRALLGRIGLVEADKAPAGAAAALGEVFDDLVDDEDMALAPGPAPAAAAPSAAELEG